MKRLIFGILLSCTLYPAPYTLADILAVTVPTLATRTETVQTPDRATVIHTLGSTSSTQEKDTRVLNITLPPLDFRAVVDDQVQFTMIAAADFSFPMQYRLGTDPEPFPLNGAGPDRCWPTAQFRSARSPGGVVLATYTISIEDQMQSIWSQKLTKEQTAALAGKTGITEISLPDGNCVYGVWYRLKTQVLSPVTQ